MVGHILIILALALVLAILLGGAGGHGHRRRGRRQMVEPALHALPRAGAGGRDLVMLLVLYFTSQHS